MNNKQEPLFEVDEVFHLEGREGHILVGRLMGGATLRAGDRVGFQGGDGAFVTLTVDGLDITPRAAEGHYSIVVTGRGAERVASGTLLTARPGGLEEHRE
jgi:hypothetical protein